MSAVVIGMSWFSYLFEGNCATDDLHLHMVDNQGDIIASFQVDPEIIVIPE